MNTTIKTFNELEIGDTIIVPGEPSCSLPYFREDHEFTVEIKHDDETVKVKELGGVVVKMAEYKVKLQTKPTINFEL